MKRGLVWAGVLAIGVATVLGLSPFRRWRLVQHFETHDPVADARIALASGDHRLLTGNFGWGPTAPGVDPRDSAFALFVAEHGSHLVVTMSDDVGSDLERRLWVSSQAYLARYNATILKAGS